MIDSGTAASVTHACPKRTMTVSPLVVASASMHCSTPRGRINRPRSAPACSIAVRISVSISFSKTISPDTACETLITVARSRCSTGAPIVLVGAGTGSSSLRWGYKSSSCRTLPSAPQTEIAIPSFPQVRVRDRIEATCQVKARGELVIERLIVNKAVCVGRADGLLVEMLSIELAAFYSCDLSAYQRGTVFEVLRTILRACFELSVVGRQSLEMPLVLVGERGIAAGRAGKPTIE